MGFKKEYLGLVFCQSGFRVSKDRFVSSIPRLRTLVIGLRSPGIGAMHNKIKGFRDGKKGTSSYMLYWSRKNRRPSMSVKRWGGSMR